jgi:hypothetical protein
MGDQLIGMLIAVGINTAILSPVATSSSGLRYR